MSVQEKLETAAIKFGEKNKEYGDAYKKHGNIMMALYPHGVTIQDADGFNKFALINAIVGKLNRYCGSEIGHPDSMHDLTVFAAMLEDYDENC